MVLYRNHLNGGEHLFNTSGDPWYSATIWNDQILIVLAPLIFSDSVWSVYNNAIFSRNVAEWISDSPTPKPTPEPATLLLFGSGIVGLAGRKFRKKK